MKKIHQAGSSLAKLSGEASGNIFGITVSISRSGNVVAVGAIGSGVNGEDSGSTISTGWCLARSYTTKPND